MKNKNIKTLLILFIFHFQHQLYANRNCQSDNNNNLSCHLISKEDSFHNGTITYQLVIKAYDTAYIDSIKIFYSFFDDYNHNGTFPLFLDSADSLVINITLDYDSVNRQHNLDRS